MGAASYFEAASFSLAFFNGVTSSFSTVLAAGGEATE